MKKLKQLNPNYPNGDCQRTVFACLLGYDNPEMIPNFTEMEETHELMCKRFNSNIQKWLDENNLTYIETTLEGFRKSEFLQLGYCTVVGKSPRGEYNHIVIGEVKLVDNHYELHYVWDTSPLGDGTFLDGEPIAIGWLNRQIV